MKTEQEHLIKRELQAFEHQTQRVTDRFIEKYFGDVTESWWVADEIGGTLYVGDYFFSLHDILNALRYKASKKKMFAYYDYTLERAMEGKGIEYNLKNYLKLK